MTRPRLVILLPARNCAADLPGYFESARRFADAIVALDDGSTDETADLLEAEPLVHILLRNPRRPTYVGWDDSANRNQLLEAAAALEPEWIFSMDADERLDASDARALRHFLDTEAVPGEGYLVQGYAMVGDTSHFDTSKVWFGRLFGWAPGQRFPEDRLHFVALPTSIPLERRRRTSLRLQHLGNLDDARRRDRFAKYVQADPSRRYQASYLNLLAPRPRIWPWWERTDHLPVLSHGPGAPSSATTAPGGVDLSVVFIATAPDRSRRDVESALGRALGSVVGQETRHLIQTIVVVTEGGARLSRLRQRFPAVRFVEIASASPADAFSAALAHAEGTYVSVLGADEELAPGYVEGCLEGHALGYAMVSHSVRNGTDSRSGWACYFLDHFGELPGRPAGQHAEAPHRCTYLRRAIEELGPVTDDLVADLSALNQVLYYRGYGALRRAELTVVQHYEGFTPAVLAAHQFGAGRRRGEALMEPARWKVSVPYGAIKAHLRHGLQRRIRLISSVTRRDAEELGRQFTRVRPWVALGVASWWLGSCYEIARRIPGLTVRNHLVRRSGRTIIARERQGGEEEHRHEREKTGAAIVP